MPLSSHSTHCGVGSEFMKQFGSGPGLRPLTSHATHCGVGSEFMKHCGSAADAGCVLVAPSVAVPSKASDVAAISRRRRAEILRVRTVGLPRSLCAGF